MMSAANTAGRDPGYSGASHLHPQPIPPGIYVDVVSGEPLFASSDKFEVTTITSTSWRMLEGNDRGTSYRSAIYYVNETQRDTALDTITDAEASGRWPGKVLTEVEPVGPF